MGQLVLSECGIMPATFFEKLASCARIDPVTGDVYLNTICYSVDCDEAESPIECGFVPTDAEQFCAASFFAVDNCGHLALKISYCAKELDML